MLLFCNLVQSYNKTINYDFEFVSSIYLLTNFLPFALLMTSPLKPLPT